MKSGNGRALWCGLSVALAACMLVSGVGLAQSATIKFVTLGDPYPTYYEPLIKMFESRHPGIRVQLEGVPFNQYFDVVEARLASGSPDPDVLFVDVPLVASYAVRGFLRPLDDMLPKSVLDAFVPTELAASRYRGQLMTIPMQSSSQVMYYNTAMFQKAGLAGLPTDPEERLTWEDVVAIARKLSGPGQWGFSLEQVDRPYQMLPLPLSLGGEPLDSTGTRVSGYVDAEPWLKAARFYGDSYRSGISPAGVIYPQTDDLFEAGRLGMLLGTELQVNRFGKNANLKWSLSLHPYFEGGRVVTPTGSWHVGINKNTRHPEEAARWVEFLASEEVGRLWYQAAGRLPVHKSVLASLEQLAQSEAARTSARISAFESTHTAVPRPMTPGYREWEDAIYRAFADIRNGADPVETLRTTAARLDQTLRKYR